MRIIRPGQTFDIIDARSSIFLAGPTPRDIWGQDWRAGAISILENEQSRDMPMFKTAFVPDPGDGTWLENYDAQVAWEFQALEVSTIIMFWVPRELQTMPAFTTNVEFGMYMTSGRTVLGYPPVTPKMKYLDWHARRLNVPVRDNLRETIWAAQDMLDIVA